MGRLFRNYDSLITQKFKPGVHGGIDLVGKGANGAMCLDYILAHSDGVVIESRGNYSTTDKTGSSYGNYIKIKHPNGMYTLYAHMKYGTVRFNVGETVRKGDVLGYMGNTGHSFGAHLHFEVRDVNDKKIDPEPYLEADLLSNDKDEEYTIYTIVKGDTLNKIAAKFKTTVEAIVKVNNISNPNKIYTGQKLFIPTDEPKNETPTELKIGDVVKLKEGATYWNGNKIPSWVFNKTLYYRGSNKNGAIISILKIGAITGTVKKEDLIRV